MTRNGFKVQCYIDARVLADLVIWLEFQKDDGKVKGLPTNLSALVRLLLTKMRDSLLAEEYQVKSLSDALDILESNGFDTRQFPEKMGGMLREIGMEEMAQPKISVETQIKVKVMMEGWNKLTEEEKQLAEKILTTGELEVVKSKNFAI